MSRFKTIDLSKVRTYPVDNRASKVARERFSRPLGVDSSFKEFWSSLPGYLASQDLKSLVTSLQAARDSSPILWMMGAHPLKVGLAPIFIDLINERFIDAIASHGAFAVHDCETALFGKTSEDVADTLKDGRFGMARETGEFFIKAVNNAQGKEIGLGEALANALQRANAPYLADSILVQGYEQNIPVTIHVAIGTDIVHEHSGLSGAALGETSYRDFLIFCESVSRLRENSVVMNIGSAVLLPEVFLKALSVARNLGNPCHGFTTANFDMIQHYRPNQNVVKRPTMTGGKGFSFTGHHEIMIPLLAAALKQTV